MDALREYSPSDEESSTSKKESPRSFHKTSSRHQRKPTSDTHTARTSQSPRRKRYSPTRRRSRSPRPRKRSSSPARRRSRSPHFKRSRTPPHYKGSSHHRTHSDRRRSPSPHYSSRHQQDSRSPPRKQDSTHSRYNDEKKSYKSGGKAKEDSCQQTMKQETDRPQWSNDDSLTPEQKLEQALASSQATKPRTVVPGMPSYINTAVINPQHFKSIQEKRKLLWGKGKDKQIKTKESWNKWESASFEGDEKGKTQSKFRRLMGIKDDVEGSNGSKNESKKTNKLLDDLEAQYEASRFMTHLAKGAGLGYGLSAPITQNKVDPNDTDDINESHR